jgi:5-methylcytosine-specific restriction endonuclease McrA
MGGRGAFPLKYRRTPWVDVGGDLNKVIIIKCAECGVSANSETSLASGFPGFFSSDCKKAFWNTRHITVTPQIKSKPKPSPQPQTKVIPRTERKLVQSVTHEYPPGCITKKQKKSWRKKQNKKSRPPRVKVRQIRNQERRLSKEEYKQKSQEFLNSREWQELRYRALVMYGRVCQCCGAKPPQVVIHVDHIKPRYYYPELSLSIDNLQILCAACNQGKGAKYENDFRPEKKEPYFLTEAAAKNP